MIRVHHVRLSGSNNPSEINNSKENEMETKLSTLTEETIQQETKDILG